MSDKMRKGDLPLPEPRSPEALDDKILAYARDHAPEPARRTAPWAWAGGFAAACVATVAVIIAVPEQGSDEALYPKSAATAGSTLKQDSKEARGRSEADSEAAAADRLVEEVEPAAARSMGSASAEARMDYLKLEAEAPLTLEARAADPVEAAAQAEAPVPDQVIQTLKDLKLYWEAGDREKAQAAWDRYREESAEALPDRIEEAFARFLEPQE